MHAITMCTNAHFVEFTVTLITIFNECMIKTNLNIITKNACSPYYIDRKASVIVTK